MHHEQAPCTEGDHAACPFDDRARSGCLWFREHVADPRKEDCRHTHYDLRWLPLPNGRVLLSALTTLPNGAEVNFQVFRSKPVVSADEVGLGDLGEALSDRAVGLVRNGVAQRAWDPGELDVFDSDGWFEGLSWELTVSDPDTAWDADNRLRVPVFRVEGGGSEAVSGPPARQLHQLRVEEEGAASSAATSWVVDDRGEFREVSLKSGRADLVASVRSGTRSILSVMVGGALPRRKEPSA